MKRRAFLAGMVAAPIAVQLPMPVLPEVVVAHVPNTLAASVGNRLLTTDVIAAEALRILRNNAFYRSLPGAQLEDVDDE